MMMRRAQCLRVPKHLIKWKISTELVAHLSLDRSLPVMLVCCLKLTADQKTPLSEKSAHSCITYRRKGLTVYASLREGGKRHISQGSRLPPTLLPGVGDGVGPGVGPEEATAGGARAGVDEIQVDNLTR